MILRHFFEAHHVSLGRHVAHDDASRAFPAPMAATVSSVRHQRLVPIFDQKNLGSCTGNACAGSLSTAPFGNHFAEADAVSIYSQATHLDSIRGYYPPTDTGSSGLAVMKAAKKRGLIGGYSHGFGLDHTLRALMLGPGITGITWLTGCDSPNNGLVRYVGSVRGGHEIELVGIDADDKLIIFANSWGDSWGKDGYFAMSWNDYAAALKDHGDATFPMLPNAD